MSHIENRQQNKKTDYGLVLDKGNVTEMMVSYFN